MTSDTEEQYREARPSVAVITVCRNEANNIRATIESVLEQTYRNYEYIVIDGASVDGTVKIIIEYNDRLTYWVSEPDNGIYDAMNKGARASSAEYLLFLNGGDRFATTSIFQDIFKNPCSADILYGDVYKDRGISKDLCSYAEYRTTPYYLFGHTLPHPGSLIKKSVFDSVGGYDTHFRLSGDYDFFLRAFVRYKASSEYLNLAISIFDTMGISQDARWRSIRRKEDELARKKNYPVIHYCLYSFLIFSYDLLIYRPRRKLMKILGKS